MKSYTKLREDIAGQCNVSTDDTAAMTKIDTLLNNSIRTVCNIRGGKWWFLEETKIVKTVASQNYVVIPQGFRKVMDLTITVGTTIYTPTPVFDNTIWNTILASNLGESDVPSFIYQVGNKVYIAPTPATSDLDVTIRGRKEVVDLTIPDVTTSTVTAIANGATAVTINAGGLASMAGKYIRITSTGAANTGDGRWYEIASATAITITLVAPYEGTTIAAGTAACTIGQMSPIPEAYDMAPVYRSSALYWLDKGDLKKATTYWRLYDGGQEAGLSDSVGGILGQMIENESSTIESNYLSPNGIGRVDPNLPPQYPLSGF